MSVDHLSGDSWKDLYPNLFPKDEQNAVAIPDVGNRQHVQSGSHDSYRTPAPVPPGSRSVSLDSSAVNDHAPVNHRDLSTKIHAIKPFPVPPRHPLELWIHAITPDGNAACGVRKPNRATSPFDISMIDCPDCRRKLKYE